MVTEFQEGMRGSQRGGNSPPQEDLQPVLPLGLPCGSWRPRCPCTAEQADMKLQLLYIIAQDSPGLTGSAATLDRCQGSLRQTHARAAVLRLCWTESCVECRQGTVISIVPPHDQHVVAKLAATLGTPNQEGVLSFGKLLPASQASSQKAVPGSGAAPMPSSAGAAVHAGTPP